MTSEQNRSTTPSSPSAVQPPQPAAASSESPISRGSLGHKIWAVVRILNVRLRFIALMVIVGLVAANWEGIVNRWDRWTRPARVVQAVQDQAIEYYCPMHPHIIRSEPGNCPICGMPLSQRAKGEKAALPEGVLAQVNLSPLKVQTGNIGTSAVEYRLLSREIRTVGVVDYDETRRAFIAARVKGRVDKLLVNFTGQKVQKGDALAWIYSPDLLVAQEELLAAARTLKEQKDPAAPGFPGSAPGSPGSPAALGSKAVLAASRQKLLLWGLTESQVEEIIQRGAPQTHVTIASPISGIVTEKKVLEGHYVMEGEDLYTVADLSTVWLQAKVFESEAAGVQVGTAVEVTSTAQPNEVFAGRITFIAYAVDPGTRTLAARVEVQNPEGKLKPGMYTNAVIRLPVGKVEPASEAELPTTQPAAVAVAAAAHEVDSRPLAQAYLALVAAYTRDQVDDQALAALERETQKLAAHVPAAGDVAKQVSQFKGKDLAGQRQALKALSAGVIALLETHPPQGLTLFVLHCPMPQTNADWLATSREIANPYWGSGMLTCGEVKGPLAVKASAAGGAATASAAAGGERFAVGYWCPVYPDRLYDKPEHCPIDKFPLKPMRVEKALAVPESAVINTGTRQVVYRQSDSAPGTFDMVQVTVGPRAGEFYPVLAGLAAGDRVATRGAFLVDAENRLNPAAGAQFFGASGGQHQH